MNQHARVVLNKDHFSRCVYFADPQKLWQHSQGRVTNRDELAETEVKEPGTKWKPLKISSM